MVFISGATITSVAFLEGIYDLVEQAGVNP